MNIHRNARLTPQGRALMVRRVVVEGWTPAVAAAAAGLSARQAYRWLARHRAGGEPALHDRSSAPARCPHRTPAIVVQEIARLRRRHLSGPRIARALSMPVSTVGAVLRREGLGRLADLEPKPRIIRYQRQAPGELIHLDTKKLGRIDGIGHRFVARGPGMHRSRGIGWDYLHVCIDDASRLAYTEILPDERKESVTAFLRRALAWLARHGVVVERVMTDNGNGYRSHLFGELCRAAGVRHIRTRPYTPRTNGKAERFIQTSLREWAYQRPYLSSAARTHAMPAWIDAYNTQRPHSALAHQTPWLRLNKLLGRPARGTSAARRFGAIRR